LKWKLKEIVPEYSAQFEDEEIEGRSESIADKEKGTVKSDKEALGGIKNIPVDIQS